MMFWLFLSLLVVAAFLLAVSRRKRYDPVEDEPWRASLREDDEPLDYEAAKRAEDEWLAESGWEDDEEGSESWRG